MQTHFEDLIKAAKDDYDEQARKMAGIEKTMELEREKNLTDNLKKQREVDEKIKQLNKINSEQE